MQSGDFELGKKAAWINMFSNADDGVTTGKSPGGKLLLISLSHRWKFDNFLGNVFDINHGNRSIDVDVEFSQ